jgi:hypothetical protein
VTDHNHEVICTLRFIYIVMISSKDIANKCCIMIVKECGMYNIVFVYNFVKIYIYTQYLNTYDIENYN